MFDSVPWVRRAPTAHGSRRRSWPVVAALAPAEARNQRQLRVVTRKRNLEKHMESDGRNDGK